MLKDTINEIEMMRIKRQIRLLDIRSQIGGLPHAEDALKAFKDNQETDNLVESYIKKVKREVKKLLKIAISEALGIVMYGVETII